MISIHLINISFIIKRDEYGLRGNYGIPENINILTIKRKYNGRTKCFEGETWSDILQKILKMPGKIFMLQMLV